MAKSTLSRHYRDVMPLRWIDDEHFIGTVVRAPYYQEAEKFACYGWTKGGNFFIYKIVNGHIEKLGSVPREELVDG